MRHSGRRNCTNRLRDVAGQWLRNESFLLLTCKPGVSHSTVSYCRLHSFLFVSTGTRGFQVETQVTWPCNSYKERDINQETTQVKPLKWAMNTLLLCRPSAVLMTI